MIICIVTGQHIYRVSQGSVPSLNDPIPEVIPSQKCSADIGMILKGCRAVDVCSIAIMMSQLIFEARNKSPWLECSFQHKFCVSGGILHNQQFFCLFMFKGHLKADTYGFCNRNCHICSKLYFVNTIALILVTWRSTPSF